MQDRVRILDHMAVLAWTEAEPLIGEIAGQHLDVGLQVVVEAVEIEVQLKGSPQPLGRGLTTGSPHQKNEALVVLFQQLAGNVSPEVARGSGEEDAHDG